jgi:hypothetical protein
LGRVGAQRIGSAAIGGLIDKLRQYWR